MPSVHAPCAPPRFLLLLPLLLALSTLAAASKCYLSTQELTAGQIGNAPGCKSDSQCTSATSDPKVNVCCSHLKTLVTDLCEGSIDTAIAQAKAGGECSDAADCTVPISKSGPSAYSFASLPLLVFSAVVGLVRSGSI
ncbi:hypothetical protein GUITHDRAFT_146489 [Guillardia theta CCMP2712]|uniref:Uncharacterized protein n=1 Tax=Guillardia theta (strain CCMP2712) TaxID=905079 RepID=L1II37_GUITC|nr:hypothetical protein GUITHDRAFT_146489 [Guillardia theta CCMP2712]EKX35475.1 hypothetical protein GUITHDRAFT_146489 [Guillardia theta CCMP2712]|eukprot:XP_005822455.1 hypothetical protein GUITHDRAFT_146489 [Guillardia theta CCMP2712]